MQKTRFVIIITVFLGLSLNVEAQFLKNLKKQILDKTTEAIIDKTANKVADSVSDKVSDQIAGTVDGALGADWGDIMSQIGSVKDIETLPASYNFDYIYSLNMVTDEKDLPVDYYLSSNNSYMGAKFNFANDITMVFDEENKALITFVGDKAIATEMSIPNDVESDEVANVKITNLPNKTFLGYDCVGRLVENDEYKMTVYVAKDTEVSFSKIFNNSHSKMPKQMKISADGFDDGMVMYAEVIDKTKKGASVTINCTAFDKTELTIKTR